MSCRRPDEVRAAAARGIAGPGSRLPHLDRIQAAFGDHDVTDVKAHLDGAARGAARAIGAVAYATGGHVAFEDAPDLRTAAHEAAHVIQQRSGVRLSSGVGKAGDAHEVHADSVADAVVAGRAVDTLLGEPRGTANAAPSDVQRQETWAASQDPPSLPLGVEDAGDDTGGPSSRSELRALLEADPSLRASLTELSGGDPLLHERMLDSLVEDYERYGEEHIAPLIDALNTGQAIDEASAILGQALAPSGRAVANALAANAIDSALDSGAEAARRTEAARAARARGEDVCVPSRPLALESTPEGTAGLDLDAALRQLGGLVAP